MKINALRLDSDPAGNPCSAGRSPRSPAAFSLGATQPGQNRSSILEFNVADVDQEYLRLQPIIKTWVKPPTTQPWGTRSIYFRDPDGNLVDFFTRVKP